MARGRVSVPTVLFTTHPAVAIDPAVAVPDWPVKGRGRERMRATGALEKRRYDGSTAIPRHTVPGGHPLLEPLKA